MGWIVKADGRIIWSPGMDVGRLFLTEVRAIEHIVSTESGVESPEPDTMVVDAVRLGAFIQRVLNSMGKTNNGPLLAMMAGCVQVCIALHRDITGKATAIPLRLRPFLIGAATVMEPVPLDSDYS